MFTLTADKDKEKFSESNVSSSTALKKSSYCDLNLYEANDGSGNFVLIAKVVMKMTFTDGVSQLPDTTGQPLVWTDAEKNNFKTAFANVIKSVWNNQYEIKAANGYYHHSVAVQFDIQVKTGATIFKHYNMNITKTDAWVQSYVKGERPFVGSDGEFDTGDVTGVNKGARMPQRAAAHEFGHMISYADEYPSPDDPTKPIQRNSNANFLTDKESIMHSGETMRQRHYTIYAAWLTKQFKGYTGTSFDDSDPIIWKVDGTLDVSNAQI